jgi:RHS repeat-associated protein
LTSTVNTATTNYSYMAGSHKLQSLSGAQSKSYAVDAAGNMTSDGTTTWAYAGNNRATQAGTTTFLVNALGQRVKKTAGSTVTHFAYDEAGRIWGEYDNTGALIAETIWLDDFPVGTFGAALSYVHPDHLGTPRMITRSSDNAIVWRWDNTDPFGNSQPDNPSGLGTFAYNLRFPGQYFDQETGSHYNYFRDYDPRIGRYIESDPIGLMGGVNPYAYVDGRPLTQIDISGLTAGSLDNWHRPLGFPDVSGEARGRAAQQLTNWWNSVFNKSDLEKCEADCEEEKKARDALCFVAKARGGKIAQKLCLDESDRIWFECRENCKKKHCPQK